MMTHRDDSKHCGGEDCEPSTWSARGCRLRPLKRGEVDDAWHMSARRDEAQKIGGCDRGGAVVRQWVVVEGGKELLRGQRRRRHRRVRCDRHNANASLAKRASRAKM